MSNDTTYEGWTNYQTWNVSLWIQNDEGLYNMALEHDNYDSFRESLSEINFTKTPDGISLTDPALNIEELDDLFRELQEDR